MTREGGGAPKIGWDVGFRRFEKLQLLEGQPAPRSSDGKCYSFAVADACDLDGGGLGAGDELSYVIAGGDGAAINVRDDVSC